MIMIMIMIMMAGGGKLLPLPSAHPTTAPAAIIIIISSHRIIGVPESCAHSVCVRAIIIVMRGPNNRKRGTLFSQNTPKSGAKTGSRDNDHSVLTN
jgi:hypothetical protein